MQRRATAASPRSSTFRKQQRFGCTKMDAGVGKGIVAECMEEEILPQMNADDADKEGEFDPVDPASPAFDDPDENRGFYPKDISNIPFMAALKRIHVTELKRGVDGYGREIFILEEQNDGRPNVWFEYDSNGKLLRKERDTYGPKIKHIDSPWLTSADLRHRNMYNPAVDLSKL